MKKHTIIKDVGGLQALDLKLTDIELLAIDTETNGLKFWRDIIIGVSLAYNSDEGFYIPFLEWVPDKDSGKERNRKKEGIFTQYETGSFRCLWSNNKYPEQVSSTEYQPPKFIKDYFKKWFLKPEVHILMHNAPFDVLMFDFNYGIDLTHKIFCDTTLLKHIIDENTSCSLKETAIQWQNDLGFNADRQANEEQIEMGKSVVKNGGKFTKIEKSIWRADLDVLGKYAAADSYLTFGLFEVGMQKFTKDYTQEHYKWFFEDEVMPLCKEVVIPMKKHGVRVDIEYFTKLSQDTINKMNQLEDTILEEITPYLDTFSLGASLDDSVNTRNIVDKIIELEGLTYPIKSSKGIEKESLDKGVIKKLYKSDPHWLWGYILGLDEIRYSEERMLDLKRQIYLAKTGQRHRFNISSDMHLRWLFCTRLGHSAKDLPQTDSATKDKIIPSMKAEVLKSHFLNKYSFIKPLLLFKKLQKLHSTYIEPILRLHNNGWLHMDMMQNGTVSGRFACRGGFNLQTLPKAEELDRCSKCESKNVTLENQFPLVGDLKCNDCGHVEEDLICSSAIKFGFIAPEGHKIVNADYSSLEPRCFSFMSGDQKLKDVYQQDLDLYSKVYIDMEDKTGKYSANPKDPNYLKKVDNAKRTMMKPVVLSIPYGARAYQVAKLMGFRKTVINKKGEVVEFVDIDKGEELRQKYLNTYPKLRNFIDEQTNQALTRGYVETIIGRRRHFKYTTEIFNKLRHLNMNYEEFLDMSYKKVREELNGKPGFKAEDFVKLSKKCGFNLNDDNGEPRDWTFVRGVFSNELNNSCNMVIQGLAAHITNMAMLEMQRAFIREGLSSKVCLTVHDEITVYAKDDEAEITAMILQFYMENNKYTKLVDIPMVAEPVICTNLKDSK